MQAAENNRRRFRGKNRAIESFLQGGLGNQLFILAATWEQAERLGASMRFDCSYFEYAHARPLAINRMVLPEGTEFYKSSRLLQNFRTWAADRGLKFFKTFHEKSFAFDKKIYSITVGSKIIGYFQSEKYFQGIKDDLISTIFSVPLNDREKEILESYSEGEFIALHIRRGDYVSNTDVLKIHGLASVKYFSSAIAELRKISEKPILVFSDDLQAAKLELQDISGVIFDDKLDELSDFATLKLFSKADSLIMSNSSFSWWGAYLLKSRAPDSQIFSPKPWFTENVDTRDLLPADWKLLPR